MNKRILATFLWFNVGWTTGAMSTFFLGLPAGLDVVLAVILGVVVWFDPFHVLWATRGTRVIHRPEERVAPPTLATE